MITHLTCPKRSEKCTGKKRGYTDESLAKLEMQQSNLGSCLAASFDIGVVRGSYLSTQNELSNKLNCNGNYTHQGEHAKIIRKLGNIQGERTSMRKIRDSNHLIWISITMKISLVLSSSKKLPQMQPTIQDRAKTDLG
ncbi:hypothetical protein YC2023_004572 [Brassica napus]